MAVVGSAAEGNTEGSRSRTEYFLMDDGSQTTALLEETPVEEGSCSTAVEVAWDREREELEKSKANFQQTIQRQTEVEQSVTSLLSRLAELPVGECAVENSSTTTGESLAPTATSSSSSSASVEQRPRVPNERCQPPFKEEGPAVLAAKAAAAALAVAASKSSVPRPSRPEPVDHRSPRKLLPGTPQVMNVSIEKSVPSPPAEEAEIMSPTLPRKSRASREPFRKDSPVNECTDYSDEIHCAEAISTSASSSAPPPRPTTPVPGSSPRVPVVSPRLGQGGAVGDSSLLPKRNISDSADTWRGWTIETSQDGRLFYHHAASSTSQWHMPADLTHVLGEWVPVEHRSADNADDSSYWRNELLGVSSWKDPRHSTNLFQAALDGNLFFLQLYTEVGGFLDAVDAKGRTALHYNCAGGSAQAVFYLLQNKATADATDQGGSTPLHWACRYGHDTVVRILLEAKADPDRQNDMGDTPVHEAAALSRVTALEWLVLARANLLLRSRENRTPLEVAIRSRSREAVDLLRRHEKRQHRSSRRAAETHVDEDSDESGPTPGAIGSTQAPRSSVCASDPERAAPRGMSRGHVRAVESPVDSGSDSDTDEPDPSLALVIVRAARPLLRGVQWLVNRVLGEKKAALGEDNRYTFDAQSNQWVLQRQDAALRQHWEAQAGTAPSEDSDDSAGSDEDERGETLTPKLKATFQAIKKATQRKPADEGDGLP